MVAREEEKVVIGPVQLVNHRVGTEEITHHQSHQNRKVKALDVGNLGVRLLERRL